jgi:hypothetical protein
MADYYPLLARALESLPENTQAARAVVYDRAKAALIGQLKNVKPPLGEDAIQREVESLEEAIARIERTHDESVAPPAADAESASASEAAVTRPKVDGTQIRRGGRRTRSLVTAVGLVAVIVPIAVMAWLWRDKPNPQPPVTPRTTEPASPPANGEPKSPERLGGGPVPEGVPAAPPREAAPQTGTDRPASGPSPSAEGVAVAQKAALVEENSQEPKQPKITSGRAFWRLDAVNSGQGQPLDTVVRATVEVPEAGLTMQLALKRNRDSALPASHTIELNFSTPAGDTGRVVRDVNPPLFRADDGARGVPIAALSVPVKENLFLIGLSDLRTDLERNTDLMRNRNWMEIPLRFASGVRANLVFEKGVAGERVIAEALKAWAQP